VTTSAAFKRTFDSIPSIFALTEDAFAREGIDTRLLHAVDLALEELFTNMVKYSTTTNGAVQVEIVAIDGHRTWTSRYRSNSVALGGLAYI